MKPLTDDQREAVKSLRSNVCVIAGAGTGKTTTLAARFIELLRAGGELDRLVAITFTEKAAAEMRERIREAIAELALREGGRWHELLDRAEHARISTFHSFCAGLLREYAFRADVLPDFRILAEGEQQLWIEQEVRDFVLRRLRMSDGAMAAVACRYGVAPCLQLLAGAVLHRSAILRELDALPGRRFTPEILIRRLGAAREQAASVFCASLDAPVLLALVENNQLYADGATEQRRRALVDLLRAVRDGRHDWQLCESMNESLKIVAGGKPDPNKAVIRRNLEVARNRIRRQWDLWIKRLSKMETSQVLLQSECDALNEFAAVFEALAEELDAAKKGQDLLDYDDLQNWLLRLLRDHADVAAEISRGIDQMLVDEFQDTDSTQLEILQCLFAADGELADGRLFIVGDAKQSIYKFRGAEVEVFNRVREQVGRHNGVVKPLESNFRSTHELVAEFNRMFSDILGVAGAGPASDYDSPYHALVARREARLPGPVEFLLVDDEPDRDLKEREFRRKEGAAIARWLAARMSAGREVYDEKQSVRRRMRWRDAAILLSQFSHVYEYERALQQQGIPYYLVGGSGFYRQAEVHDMAAALSVAANCEDDLWLAALLRSPMFCLSDEGLHVLGRGRGGKVGAITLWSRLCAPPAELGATDAAVARYARECIDKWRRLQAGAGAHEVMCAILADTQYDHVLRAGLMGGRKLANLHKMLELARTFDGSAGLGVAEFVRYLRDYLEREMRLSEASDIDEDADAVKILTVHKAKGLEFPVVIVADVGNRYQFVRGGAGVRVEKGWGVALPAGQEAAENAEAEATDWVSSAVIRNVQSHKGWLEEKRKLYVAATRARDCLVFSGDLHQFTPERAGLSWLDLLDGVYGLSARLVGGMTRKEGEPLLITSGTLDSELSPVDVFSKQPREAPVDSPKLHAKAQTLRVVSVSEAVSFLRDERQWYQRYVAGLSEESFDRRGGGGRLGRVRGSVVHELFERAMRDRALPSDKEIDRAVHAQQGLSEVECAELAANCRRCLSALEDSELWRLAAGAEKVLPEQPFLLDLRESALEGIIDLFVVDGQGRVWVADYKTDANKSAIDLQQAYSAQLRCYALAAEQLGGRDVTAVGLFSTELRQWIEIPWGTRERVELTKVLEKLPARMREAKARLEEGVLV